jgi:Ala-tRNA(Pro) deacylase
MEHEAVFTSEQAALVRGTPLASGAKALICKANDDFQMFVMPANLKLFTRGVRKALGIQRLRFASKEELLELTGLAPGCVPPFGSLFGLPTWCDLRLADQPRINFNAGDHTISIGIDFSDYTRIESPKLSNIAK